MISTLFRYPTPGGGSQDILLKIALTETVYGRVTVISRLWDCGLCRPTFQDVEMVDIGVRNEAIVQNKTAYTDYVSVVLASL